jgi:N-terminal domain of NWD NACHT-NTPase/NACHT domain
VYVGSRAEWYCELYKLAAEEDVSARRLLEDKLIGLYEKLITFQMRSVGYYYQSQLKHILRDAFKVNAWEGALKDIKEAEDSLRTDASDYDRKMQRAHLSELERSAKLLQERVTAQLDKILAVNTKMLGLAEEDAKKRASKEASLMIGKFLLKGLDYKTFMDENPDPEMGTCTWFLDDGRVKSWNDGLLLVTAIPGQGKSVLARFLVQQWRRENTVCYFFFKATSEVRRNAASGFCALVHQLFEQHPEVAEIQAVQNHVERCGRNLTSAPILQTVLELVLSHIGEQKVIFVLDALDECSDLSLVEPLISFCEQKAKNVKILSTARLTKAVTDALEITTRSCVRLDLNDRSTELALEVDMVIDRTVQRLAPKLGWSANLEENIKRELKARGHFRPIEDEDKALRP